MKKIEAIGNLPNHMKAFAKPLEGLLSDGQSTIFYEMSSISEFEINATEIGYEIVPTIDQETGRGFLVGFDVSEPKRIATLLNYSSLNIYFVECSDTELKVWIDKMKMHRDAQQNDMFQRRETTNSQRKKNIKVRGEKP